MATVESVTLMRTDPASRRHIYRICLSGDRDWNGDWRGIEVLGNPYLLVYPGDQLWYGGDRAYWTRVVSGVTMFPHDMPLQRYGYDFTALRATR